MDTTLFALIPGGIGAYEMMIFGVIALLLFGKRLPEVARSLGKGIVEFKKGVKGIEEEIDGSVDRRPVTAQSRPVPEETLTENVAPKFEPPRFEPAATENTSAVSS